MHWPVVVLQPMPFAQSPSAAQAVRQVVVFKQVKPPVHAAPIGVVQVPPAAVQ